MNTDLEIEQSSGNVYSDLGFPDADEMLIKAQLTAKIIEILAARNWTQQEASKVLRIPQPKLSRILRGQFRGVSQAKLMTCLTRLGLNMQIIISSEQLSSSVGQIQVLSN